MSIWHGEVSLETLNRLQHDSMPQNVGIIMTEIGPDFLRGTMPVDHRTCQPFGMLHGGASVVLAETLGSVAANTCVDRAKFLCVGQEINANHLRSVPRGQLVSGIARPIHLGGRSQVWGIEIHDQSNNLVCVSRLTIAVIAQSFSLR
jgi:1,4-dihydroxy-2-naphthoyl-CoA hydrolase